MRMTSSQSEKSIDAPVIPQENGQTNGQKIDRQLSRMDTGDSSGFFYTAGVSSKSIDIDITEDFL